MINGKHPPRYLNLLQIRQPVTAVTSILHRVSGVWLFLCTPWVIYLLQLSLSSEQGFERSRYLLTLFPVKLVLGITLWAAVHHLFAGIRFLLLDIDVGIELAAARRSAWGVNVGALVVALIFGLWAL